jgi:hypothetical protein
MKKQQNIDPPNILFKPPPPPPPPHKRIIKQDITFHDIKTYIYKWIRKI